MLAIPAIDIRGGRCVRLTQGNYMKEEVFSANVLEVAKRWEREGAELLQVIDLDGAEAGSLRNMALIREISANVRVPIQVGGGISSHEMAKALLDSGVARVIVGTAAFRSPDLVGRLVEEYGKGAVCIAADYNGGSVVIDGWKSSLDIPLVSYLKRVEGLHAGSVLLTCVERDGMLSGADVSTMKSAVESMRMPVMAAGGVGSVQDLIKLRESNAYGVVIGKALYKGNVSLKDAIACLRS